MNILKFLPSNINWFNHKSGKKLTKIQTWFIYKFLWGVDRVLMVFYALIPPLLVIMVLLAAIKVLFFM